jgi:hypothetical protein
MLSLIFSLPLAVMNAISSRCGRDENPVVSHQSALHVVMTEAQLRLWREDFHRSGAVPIIALKKRRLSKQSMTQVVVPDPITE